MPREETFEEEIARLDRERSDFITKVKTTFAAHRVFLAPIKYGTKAAAGEYGWITITRSTRPGVNFQLTYWEGDPRGSSAVPTGHMDITGSIEKAAEEAMFLAERSWNG